MTTMTAASPQLFFSISHQFSSEGDSLLTFRVHRVAWQKIQALKDAFIVPIIYGAWKGVTQSIKKSTVLIGLSSCLSIFSPTLHRQAFAPEATRNLSKIPLSTAAFFAPIIEEFLFRGFLENTIHRIAIKISTYRQIPSQQAQEQAKKISRIVGAILFGAAHLTNGMSLQVLFTMYDAYYVLTPLKDEYGLLASISVHIVNNFIFFIL